MLNYLTNANEALKKVLFIIGSLNQTTQMHKIASCMPEYDCYFSQFYSDNLLIKYAVNNGVLDGTILSGKFKQASERYLEEYNLKNDYALSRYKNDYDLVVTCSDILVPQSIRRFKTLWVQEGMTDRINLWGKLVGLSTLPKYFAMGTSLNGTSNICDVYCAASQGYKDHFEMLGGDPNKIIVTGIPNFDHASVFLDNDFPFKDYILIATSDIRECYGLENRPKFIKNVVKIANGRKLIFKLHPNEAKERAIKEIEKYAPSDTLIYSSGNINHMIANCAELITQYSTVVYVGLALNKKVHSYFDVEQLKTLMPIQNGGRSASNIAEVCKEFIHYNGKKDKFLNWYQNKKYSRKSVSQQSFISIGQ